MMRDQEKVDLCNLLADSVRFYGSDHQHLTLRELYTQLRENMATSHLLHVKEMPS